MHLGIDWNELVEEEYEDFSVGGYLECNEKEFRPVFIHLDFLDALLRSEGDNEVAVAKNEGHEHWGLIGHRRGAACELISR